MFLPGAGTWHGRGGSFAEPCEPSTKPPRIFHQEGAAKRALNAWLKGQWHCSRGFDDFHNEYYEETSIEPKPERRAEDMEIVPLSLVEE